MLKRFLFSVLLLLIGAFAAVVVTQNPWQWGWVAPLQHRVQSLLHGSSNGTEEQQAEGQLWTCGMHPQVIQDHPGNCPICGMPLVPLQGSAGQPSTSGAAAEAQPSGEKKRKIKYWVAPMDPTYISDKPGKSPMGMDLVPVYEDEEPAQPEKGVVQIDPAFVQNIGVQSITIERTDIPYTIRTIGTVTYNDKQLYWINTKFAGWLENVSVTYIGQPVQKGQVLFEIYSPELVTTQQEYLNALDYAERLSTSDLADIRERARSLVEASRQRLRYWDITDEQIRELEKSRKPRRTLKVVSPVDGLVVEKMDQALEGMYVKPGMNLYKIVDLSTMWVEAEVFEHQLPWLKLGQHAILEFPGLPGNRFHGTIRYLYPAFNQKTRTARVSIEVPNPGQQLRADMYANVTFEVPAARNVIAVPENAVIHSGERNIVVLDQGAGRFQVREVTLGRNGNDLWEVLEGLHEGDRVVVSSQFLIDSESNLREAIQKMLAARQQQGEAAPPPPVHQH
ncbi:MAG: hypothetical protein Kow00109_25580 [Acidobacteriota bacterium]